MKIHKYKLPLFFGEVRLMLHDEAKILHFGNQYSLPTIWVLEDPVNRLVERQFFVVPTGGGGEGFEKLEFIGTALFDNGDLVLHLFQPPSHFMGTVCGVTESRPLVHTKINPPSKY